MMTIFRMPVGKAGEDYATAEVTLNFLGRAVDEDVVQEVIEGCIDVCRNVQSQRPALRNWGVTRTG